MESQPSSPTSMPRNKKIGLMWIIGPFLLIASSLFLFAVVRFLAGSLGGSRTVFQLVNVLLSFFALIGIVGIPVGMIVGIIYVTKDDFPVGATADPRSGLGAQSIIPPEIRGWNWGAAGLNWIWGIVHHVWISLLVFIPIFGLIGFFVLGFNGNEWAWRKRKWQSVEHFLAVQKKWRPWGIFFFVLALVSTLVQLIWWY